jgi:hypothetical protein
VYRQVQPIQSETADFVALDPENESGNNNPPVPTYAEIELFPPTSGVALKLGELTNIARPMAIAIAEMLRLKFAFI